MKFRFRRRLLGVSAALASLVFAGSAVAQVRTQQPGLQPGQATQEVQPGQDQPDQQPGRRTPDPRATGQLPPGQPQPGATQPGATRQQGQGTMTDAQIAAILILDNRTEVEMAQLALQRAESDEVKRFAQQMIEDHTQFIGKLQPFAGHYANVIGRQGGAQPRAIGQPDRINQQDPNQLGVNQPGVNPPQVGNQPGQPGVQPGQPGQAADRTEQDRSITRRDLSGRDLTGRTGIEQRGAQGGLDLVELKQRVGERVKQSMRSALEEHDGAQFDQAYMGQQLMMHMVMVDGMHVLGDYASPQFRAVLDEGRQTAEEHLEHAKKIKEKLSKDDSERTARSGADSRRE